MSVFIDRTFLLRASPKLQKFTQKKTDLYNFRCPLCGDSSKNKTKARGYIFAKKNNYFYMCHNCGASINFYNFLEKVDESLCKEYALERYKNADTGTKNEKPTFDEFKTETPKFRKKLELPSIESLPEAHFAKAYVQSRKIPEAFHSDLYFAEDFKGFVEKLGIEKEGLKEDKLFGTDRINQEEMIYVVEGPIDSMFLENAVATADSNLMAAAKHFDKSKIVLVYDNEPRNKELHKQMDKAIEEHYNVVIWPEMIEEKDVNDMVLNGFSPDEIQDIISKNTFVNLRAKMEFINWKKT